VDGLHVPDYLGGHVRSLITALMNPCTVWSWLSYVFRLLLRPIAAARSFVVTSQSVIVTHALWIRAIHSAAKESPESVPVLFCGDTGACANGRCAGLRAVPLVMLIRSSAVGLCDFGNSELVAPVTHGASPNPA
jgi:hypothetical protein